MNKRYFKNGLDNLKMIYYTDLVYLQISSIVQLFRNEAIT